MSNTFAERNPDVDKIRIKSHLIFVIQHWYLNYLAINQNSDSIKYIIVALLNQEAENSENNRINMIQKRTDDILHLIQDEHETALILEHEFYK